MARACSIRRRVALLDPGSEPALLWKALGIATVEKPLIDSPSLGNRRCPSKSESSLRSSDPGMGNQPSQSPEGAPSPSSRPNSGSLHQSLRNMLRPSGSLGLSKSELDKRCLPSGLYASCKWDDKAIRRLVGDGKIAARLRGTELRTSPADTECPICFLHYYEVNVTKCCQAHICTECYLQVRPQKVYAPCPFCNSSRLQINIAKTLGPKAIQLRVEDEQRVIEATIRSRAETKLLTSPDDGENEVPEGSCVEKVVAGDLDESNGELSAKISGFGASLAQDTRVASIRKRSESLVSESSQNTSSESLVQDITALAITPEERALLEEEVRVQHLHPLAQRIESEQMERRLQNERQYYRTQLARLRELRARRELMSRTLGQSAASWMPMSGPSRSSGRSLEFDRMVRELESRNGGRHSLDDLLLLEAAIMLSMQEEIRQPENDQIDPSSPSAIDETSGLSQQLHENEGNEENSDYRHAISDLMLQLRSVARAVQSNRETQQSTGLTFLNPSSFVGGATSDFESVLLRGISEEEQIAMAIAASLNESGIHNNEAEETQH